MYERLCGCERLWVWEAVSVGGCGCERLGVGCVRGCGCERLGV